MMRFPEIFPGSCRRVWLLAGFCLASCVLATKPLGAESPIGLDPPPLPPAGLLAPAVILENASIGAHVDDRSAPPQTANEPLFDVATALSGRVSDRGLPAAPDEWSVHESTAISAPLGGGLAPVKLPHGKDMKVVAVAQLAPQREAKPGEEPRPAEVVDLSQLGRTCAVAAILSPRDAKELDAPSIARNLLASGQVPQGFRLVRVAKVRFAARTAEPPADQPAAEKTPIVEDKPEAAIGADQTAGKQQRKPDRFPPIGAMTVNTEIKSTPPAEESPQAGTELATALFRMDEKKEEYPHIGDVWLDEGFFLEAARFCHQPLYFEEVNLERFGTSRYPLLQPVISGVRFLATVPVLPYLMTVDRPRCCQYEGSPYLAGRPAPWHKELPPLRVDALTVEMLVATGVVFVLP